MIDNHGEKLDVLAEAEQKLPDVDRKIAQIDNKLEELRDEMVKREEEVNSNVTASEPQQARVQKLKDDHAQLNNEAKMISVRARVDL
jgi:chromosome segregation ATPase